LDKPFSVVTLDGKLANLLDETPTDKVNAEIFKAVTSGGYVRAAQKGKPEYDLRCDSRFIFAANRNPYFNETSTGIVERLYFLPFKRYIQPADRDPRIVEKIVTTELSGILNAALDGLSDLISRGRLYETTAHRAAMEDYRTTSDSIFGWARDSIEVNPEVLDGVATNVLYMNYQNYCLDNKRKPVGYLSFSKRLAAYLREMLSQNDFDQVFVSTGDGRGRGYSGVKLRAVH